MIEFNINNIPAWAIKLIFWRIDFELKGTYSRDMFIFYHTYRENYYFKMNDGWKIHNISNYGIFITVWYFKPD